MKSNYAMTTSDSIVPQPKSHLNSVISCHLCSRTFSHEGYLKMHMRSHLSEKIYVCQICSKTFTRQGHLKVHMKTHVSSSMTKSKPGNVFTCEICSYTSILQSSYSRHMRTHQPKQSIPNSISCPECNRSFTTQRGLKDHSTLHASDTAPVRMWICDICSRSFIYKNHLLRHIETHTNPKSYSCSICPKKFSQKGNLNIHMAVHTNEKRYFCEFCDRGFYRKYHLTSHRNRHVDNKPFVCTLCGRKFVDKQCLRTHLQTHTNGSNSTVFHCAKCPNRRFKNAELLAAHKKLHNSNDGFNCSMRLEKHKMAVHFIQKQFKCELCDKQYCHKTGLYVHRKNKHPGANCQETKSPSLFVECVNDSDAGVDNNRKLLPENKHVLNQEIHSSSSDVGWMDGLDTQSTSSYVDSVNKPAGISVAKNEKMLSACKRDILSSCEKGVLCAALPIFPPELKFLK
eukprot:17528_1